MKKTYVILTLLYASINSAQVSTDAGNVKKDTTYWKKAGFFGLTASQTAASDWNGGGQNNVALNAIFNFQADYTKDKYEWSNKLDMQYGIIKPGDVHSFRKNIDQIFALTKFDIKAFNKYWFYVTQADYRTQFAPGYQYKGDSIIGKAVSDFNSPGYVQLAVGLDFKPADYFSATFAPAAGKITFVNRQYLADDGAYGVDKATYDENGLLLTHGKRMRYEFGGRVILKFKKDLFKNVNLDSYLDLFSNYQNNPGNIDVIFNNLLTIKIQKYFTVNVISQMVYDNDIIRKRSLDGDNVIGNSKGEINGPRLQLLTTLSVGFGYKF